jgi:hypothetical protein
MSNPVIICAALTGAATFKQNSTSVPYTIEEFVLKPKNISRPGSHSSYPCPERRRRLRSFVNSGHQIFYAAIRFSYNNRSYFSNLQWSKNLFISMLDSWLANKPIRSG